MTENETKTGGVSAAAPLRVVPGRSCGDCTMCCKLLKIEVLDKPRGTWCQHCKPGKGCLIYASRPSECQDFLCGYMNTPQLGEEWKPVHSKIVLAADMGGKRITAHVDPQRPDAWRAEPYYSTLKKWARLDRADRKQVLAAVGNRVYVILPDKEIDLGIVNDDEIVVVGDRQTPAGPEVTAFKLPKSDPRAQKLVLKSQADHEKALKNLAAQEAAFKKASAEQET